MIERNIYPSCSFCVHNKLCGGVVSGYCAYYKTCVSKTHVFLEHGKLKIEDVTGLPLYSAYICKRFSHRSIHRFHLTKESIDNTLDLMKVDYFYGMDWVFPNEPMKPVEIGPIADLESKAFTDK